MASRPFLSRRQLVKKAKSRGWTLHPTALEGMSTFLQMNENDEEALWQLLEPHRKDHATVTPEVWQAALEAHDQDLPGEVVPTSSRSTNNRTTATALAAGRNVDTADQPFADLEVVSAFECPKLVYQTMRKQFQVQEKQWSLFGKAEDKANMLAHRYALAHQRILRNDLFRTSSLGELGYGGRERVPHKLTPIESLLGRKQRASPHGKNKRSNEPDILLLGMLTQRDEGQYYLEDPTGQIPVTFAESAIHTEEEGFFVAEQCILLVEGIVSIEGAFHVHRLTHPLPESREDSLQAIGQQVAHPAYNMQLSRRPATARHYASSSCDTSSFVIMSDVHLDQPRVMQRLEGLLASYENYSPHRLPLFCFMGNFWSPAVLQPSSQQQQQTQPFARAVDDLTSLVAKFPTLAAHARVVLVPGPRDGASGLGVAQHAVLPLPKPAASATLLHRIAHCHVATNPCRLRWQGKEMVVFRYDLLRLLQREQLPFSTPHNVDNEEDDGLGKTSPQDDHHRKPHCRMIKTILDQGHLVPVAGVPIYWNYDHALHLYPLPDVLVLGLDRRPDLERDGAFEEDYGDCHVVYPGSMTTQHGSYATVDFGADENNELAMDLDGEKEENPSVAVNIVPFDEAILRKDD